MTAAKKILDEKFLKTLVPLGDMDPERFNQLPTHYSIEKYEAGSRIFGVGDRDERTYWLLSGQVTLEFRGGNNRIITANTSQARYALVPEQPRQATAVAKTPISLLSMDSATLDEFMHWNDRQNYQVSEIDGQDESDWMTMFLQSKVFLKLPAQNIQALMMRLEEIKTRAGQLIIRQGEDDGYYYIIKKGQCSVTRKHSPQDEEIELAVLSVGAGFGEEAIITHNRRGASVTMMDDGCLMRLSRNDFTRLLVEPLIQSVNYHDVAEDPKNLFLDVRPYDDFIKDSIKDSTNIILTQLRPSIDELDGNKVYTVCSNTGSRASAAAFLLCQQGIEARVLRHGLENLSADVERGNSTLAASEDIPVVDNVVNFTSPDSTNDTQLYGDEEYFDDQILDTPKKYSTDEAMQDPAIRALFTKAQLRVKHEAQKAADAEIAKIQAKAEADRLKKEADTARKEAEQARKDALDIHKNSTKTMHENVEKAREQAAKDAARVRELELGAKQAEMEEAVRQAEDEANRAHEASVALRQAETEIAQLKSEMQQAIEQTQEEAKKSQAALKLHAQQLAKQQQLEHRRMAEQHARRMQEVEVAKQKAEQEAERLRSEADAIRSRLEIEVLEKEKQARHEAELEIQRIRAEELEKEKSEKLRAAQEAAIHAQRAKTAEDARIKAEAEVVHIKKQAEKQQYKIKQDVNKQLEQARAQALEEANKVNAEQQVKITAALNEAEAQAERVRLAEEARVKAESEVERIRLEAENARAQMKEQLSSDIARSEIEHEVARARALELANKQAELDEIALKADEEARRAQQAEHSKTAAEQEIARLKAEIEAVRNNEVADKAGQNETTSKQFELELQRARDAEVAKIRDEIELVAQKAEDEAQRAQLAENEHQKSQQEIERLKAEMEVATLQAQAQLKADADNAEAEQEALQQRAVEIESLQNEIENATRNALIESQRAKNAEHALNNTEQEVIKLRSVEAANAVAQQELERKRAEQDMRKQMEVEAAKLKAKEQSLRAQQAERERLAAENEIRRLNAVSKEQRVKAEQAIQKTINDARKEVDNKLVRLRAAEKAVKAVGKDFKKQNKSNSKPKSAGTAPKVKSKPKTTKNTSSNQWISDQVMWETTLGIREDDAAEKLISPNAVTRSNTEPFISQVDVLDNDSTEDPKRAKYTIRDVNPHVQTQDVTEYATKTTTRRGGIVKIVFILLGCIVLGAGAYYVGMGKNQRNDLKDTVANDKTIKSIKNTVNQKLGATKAIKNDSEKSVPNIEQRIQKKKAKTDRARLQQKNVGNEFKTTLSPSKKPKTRAVKKTAKTPVKSRPPVSKPTNRISENAKPAMPPAAQSGLPVVVDIESAPSQAEVINEVQPATSAPIPAAENNSLPENADGSFLREAEGSSTSDPANSSIPSDGDLGLPVIVDSVVPDNAGTTLNQGNSDNIELDDNLNISIGQPAVNNAVNKESNSLQSDDSIESDIFQ